MVSVEPQSDDKQNIKMSDNINKNNNRNKQNSCNSSCRRELRRFGELTSIKGVGRSIKAELRGLKVMWACAVVGFFCVTVFNVWTLTDEFLDFGTGTKITERNTEFTENSGSDVMLCNINPYSVSAVGPSLQLVESYQQLMRNWTLSDNTSDFKRVSEELLTGQLGLYQHIGQKAASSVSHELRNLVLSCTVQFLDGVMERTVPCTQGNVRVERVVNKEYFNCYKFYGGTQSGGSKPSIGMSFLVHVFDIRETHSMTVNGNSGKGVIMTLAEKGSFLNPNTRGLEILPGVINNIKFSRTKRLRLPYPWGNCLNRSDLSNSVSSQFANGSKTSYLYTEDLCVSTCIEYNMIQTCECQDVGQYGVLLDVFKNVSMCGSSNDGRAILLERMGCAQKWRSEFRKKCVPKCTAPCQEEDYSNQITYLKMSSSEINQILGNERDQSSVPILESEKGHSGNDIGITTDDSQHHVNDNGSTAEGPSTSSVSVLENVSELNISSMALIQLRRAGNSYFVVEDIKAMTVSDYLAKIGGTLNLWSGITVFVLVEFLDLFLRLVTGAFKAEKETVKQNICDHKNSSCNKNTEKEIDIIKKVSEKDNCGSENHL